MPIQSEPDPKVVAYHEAGHAVVAIVRGWRFISVSIVPNPKERAGEFKTQTRYPCAYAGCQPGMRLFADLETEIMCWLGGAAAESALPGETFDEVGSAFDFAKAREYSSVAFGGDVAKSDAFVRSLFEETKVLVRQHWKGLEAIASELLRRRPRAMPEVVARIHYRQGMKPFGQ
jgi:hypothetical protein